MIEDESTAEAESLNEWMVLLLTRFLHDLQQRPITQEIMRWELLEGNELTHELAQVRDRMATQSLEFLNQKCSFPPDKDIPAISAVLIAGIVYLVLRTKVSHTFLGIENLQRSGNCRSPRPNGGAHDGVSLSAALCAGAATLGADLT